MPWGGTQPCLRPGEPPLASRFVLDQLAPIADFETREEAEWLFGVASGRRVLEIGTYVAFATCLFALGGAQHVDSIDPHLGIEGLSERPLPRRDTLVTALLNLDHYGVRDRVTLHVGPSAAVLPDLRSDIFHLVFVDGDHEWAMEDTIGAWRLLQPHGLMVWHDVGRWPAIDRALGWVRDQGIGIMPAPGTLACAEKRP